jgi:hypothetical protein
MPLDENGKYISFDEWNKTRKVATPIAPAAEPEPAKTPGVVGKVLNYLNTPATPLPAENQEEVYNPRLEIANSNPDIYQLNMTDEERR